MLGVPSAGARWIRPFRLAPPVSLAIAGPQVALSAGGSAGIGFTVFDEDNPADSQAFVTLRSPSGRLSGPIAIPGSRQLLGLAWAGRTLELLTGQSPAGAACCSAASVVPISARGRFGRPETMVGSLAGAALGELVVLGRRTLAAIVTEGGVWVAQSDISGRWGKTWQLAGPAAAPEALDATAFGRSRTAVTWVGGSSGPVGPRSLFLATGTASRAPRRVRGVVTVAPSHGIDELASAPGSGGATAAWIESWFDRHGNYRSEVVVEDSARRRRTVALSVPGRVASGLALAGDRRGDQVMAWSACSSSGTCSVEAAARPAGRFFERPVRLGSIDATEAPAVAVSSGGLGLLGWIDHGQVLARTVSLRPSRFSATTSRPVSRRPSRFSATTSRTVSRRPPRFSATTLVSANGSAAGLSLAFSPTGGALAAWSQGVVAADVAGAVFRP